MKEGAQEAMKVDSSVSDLPDLVRDALLGMPHTNSRKTSMKWYDFYDQETMELTYEMYGMDFRVFGYSSAIKERPDLMPPREDRRSQLTALKFDKWSRNSYVDTSTGRRLSQMNLLGSVKSSVRQDMSRRASMRSLKDSLVQLNKDEILAKVAGIRTAVGGDEDGSLADLPDAAAVNSMMGRNGLKQD